MYHISMAKQLSEKDLSELKRKGLLKESETAFKEGTVVVAEDLVTKERRVLNVSGLLLEANRQVLHD